MKGTPGYEQLWTHVRAEVRPDSGNGIATVGVEHQDLQRVAQVVMVELVGAYPVHDDLGFRGDKEVERRCVGAVALVVGFGQRLSRDPQRAAVGRGDEAACWVPLEAKHLLDLVRR